MNVHEAAVGDHLMVQPIGLHFEIIVVLSEDLAVFSGRARGRFHILLADQIGHLAAQTAG